MFPEVGCGFPGAALEDDRHVFPRSAQDRGRSENPYLMIENIFASRFEPQGPNELAANSFRSARGLTGEGLRTKVSRDGGCEFGRSNEANCPINRIAGAPAHTPRLD